MVNFTLPSTTNEMISISTSQTFRSWVVIFDVRQPMAFLSLNSYDTPGLASRMNVLFWGQGDFPVSYSNRDTSWNAWNRHSALWSIRRSYSAIWNFHFTNVKEWHSDPWPTVTSQQIRLSTNFMTLIPSLTFTGLWVVSMEHLQQVWHGANRERLLFWNLVPPPPPILGRVCAPIVETKFFLTYLSCLNSTFHLEYPKSRYNWKFIKAT